MSELPIWARDALAGIYDPCCREKGISVLFAEILGKLLFWCGEDKIIYGSEAPLFHPQWALRAFMDFQIPEDLCAGYGYPQLTDQAKRKILGENLLRLHGMDVAETKARILRNTANPSV